MSTALCSTPAHKHNQETYCTHTHSMVTVQTQSKGIISWSHSQWWVLMHYFQCCHIRFKLNNHVCRVSSPWNSIISHQTLSISLLLIALSCHQAWWCITIFNEYETPIKNDLTIIHHKLDAQEYITLYLRIHNNKVLVWILYTDNKQNIALSQVCYKVVDITYLIPRDYSEIWWYR